MKTTIELLDSIYDYLDECDHKHRKPSHYSFGRFIGVLPTTIRHVCNGCYADDKPYTDKPHIKRVIDNSDFDLIRELFRDK